MLNDKQRGDVIRLFSDEGMVQSLEEICQMTADQYKERSFRQAYSANPDLTSIAQDACKGFAFENIMLVLRAEFVDATKETEE